ncbi:hypothetical protein [Qipengyuania sp.]|uniref:hypothetical protein n=1 Tax=Qipengyuania sp. TaxID=2004515 RepID=UPI0035C7F7EB
MNSDWILSLAVLAALALFGGAAYLWRKPNERRRAILMAVAALVVLLNVAIWSLPAPQAPAEAPPPNATP